MKCHDIDQNAIAKRNWKICDAMNRGLFNDVGKRERGEKREKASEQHKLNPGIRINILLCKANK